MCPFLKEWILQLNHCTSSFMTIITKCQIQEENEGANILDQHYLLDQPTSHPKDWTHQLNHHISNFQTTFEFKCMRIKLYKLSFDLNLCLDSNDLIDQIIIIDRIQLDPTCKSYIFQQSSLPCIFQPMGIRKIHRQLLDIILVLYLNQLLK